MVSRFYSKNNSEGNLKYLTRMYYYGRLKDIEYVSGAMVLIFEVYTATEYFGGFASIRLYVPTELEDSLRRVLVVGAKYFVISAPYRITLAQKYKHRVDLLLNIFEEVI